MSTRNVSGLNHNMPRVECFKPDMSRVAIIRDLCVTGYQVKLMMLNIVVAKHDINIGVLLAS